MDQFLIAMLAVVLFAAFMAGYFFGTIGRKSLDSGNVHSDRDDVEKRARRAF